MRSDRHWIFKWIKLLFFWRWPARLRCEREHGCRKPFFYAIRACQYVDDPNDNHGEWNEFDGRVG